MKDVMLVTGGARSGKSRFAMETALRYEKRVFLATAPVCDSEMEQRIAAHRAERGGRFLTIEEPLDLAGALGSVPPDTDVILLDCLTVWTGNLMHRHGAAGDYAEIDAFFAALKPPPAAMILVTNEVGCGIVPENAMARRFRDLAGTINQRAAAVAAGVVLCVSGIPVAVKGEIPASRGNQ